jgi:hypothetical protein
VLLRPQNPKQNRTVQAVPIESSIYFSNEITKVDGDHPRLEILCSIRLSYVPMRAQIIVSAVEVIPNLGLQRL